MRLFLSSLLSLGAAASAITTYSLLDPTRVLLQGRYLATPNGTVAADIELFSISFHVANATAILLRLDDRTASGARLAVTLDTRVGALSDPNPSGSAMPGLRVATLLTSRQVPLYNLGSGGQVHGLSLRVTVTLLSEWEMIGASAQGGALEFVSLDTDGTLLPAPARPSRRLAILGDSLSSGVGCGFSSAPGTACGAGVPIDDASATWAALVCANFSAECELVAGSGITLFADKAYNLPMVFPYALGAMGSAAWPVAQRVQWSFDQHPVDAVLLELGENDCHALNCSSPSDLAQLVDAFVAFVTALGTRYYPRTTPFFLAIANHEAGQSRAMLLALPPLTAAGFHVTFLNATAPNAVNNVSIDTGCAGHPSAAQQQLSFERAQAAVAAVLGW